MALDSAGSDGVPPEGIESAGVGGQRDDDIQQVAETVVDCEQVYESIQKAISDAVRSCLNECEAGNEACTRCVAGTIEAAYPQLTDTLNRCYGRLAIAVSNDMDYIRSIGLSVGLPPITPVTAGDTVSQIVDTSGSSGAGTVAVSPGQTLPAPVVGVGSQFPGAPDINAPASAGGCIPADWNQSTVLAWLTSVYGGGVITAYPGPANDGIYVTAQGGTYRIPNVCTVSSNAGNVGVGGGQIQPPLPAPPAEGQSPTPIPSPIQTPVQGQPSEGTPRPNQPIAVVTPIQTDNPNGGCIVVASGPFVVPDAINAQLATYPAGTIAQPVTYPVPAGYNVTSAGTTLAFDNWGCGWVFYSPDNNQPAQPAPITGQPTPVNPGGGICNPHEMESLADNYGQIMAAADGLGTQILTPLSGMIGAIIGGSISKLTGISDIPFVQPALTAIVGGIFSITGDWLRPIILPSSNDQSCKSDAFIVMAARNAIAGAFGGWFGMVPESTRLRNQYNLSYYCPNRIPDQGQLNTLYVRGFIDDVSWETPTRMLGNCPEWQRTINTSNYTRPGVAEAIAAHRRGLVDQDTLTDLLVKSGVKQENYQNLFYSLTSFIPGPSDIVTFMVRDVFDPVVVDKYRLDDEFTTKFTGDALAWAKAQGMDENVFKYYWRSHWQIPGIGQLQEMVYRLRPTNRSANDQFPDVVVTLDDVRQAIKVNDMSPTWVEPLIATSYRVTTRVDIRRQYEIGAIELDDVERGYLDLGYTAEAAKAQVRFTQIDSGPKRAKRQGYAAPNDILNWYNTGAVNRDDADFLLRQAGLSGSQSATTLDTADLKLRSVNRANAVKAYRRRYMTGEFTDVEIIKPLTDAGLDQDKIAGLVASWRIERDAKYKGPTAAMLCNWYGRGLLGIDEFERRITNMGYSHVDATRIIQTCIIGDTARKQKEAQALQAKLEQKQKQANAEAKANEKALAAARKALAPCKPPPKPVCTNGQASTASG